MTDRKKNNKQTDNKYIYKYIWRDEDGQIDRNR